MTPRVPWYSLLSEIASTLYHLGTDMPRWATLCLTGKLPPEVAAKMSEWAATLAAIAERLTATLAAGDSSAAGPSAHLVMREPTAAQWAHMRERKYRTNELVRLRRVPRHGPHHRELQVTGLVFHPGARLYRLVRALMLHAKSTGGEFMTPHDLADAVTEVAPAGGPRERPLKFFEEATEEDVRRLFSAARKEITTAGGHPALLESSDDHHGYRFSTAPWNLHLEDDEEDRSRC